MNIRFFFFTVLFTISALTSLAAASNSSSAGSSSLTKSESDFLHIRLDPHWLLLKELDLGFQFLFAGHFSIGPTLGYMSGGDGIYAGGLVSDRLFYKDQTTRQSLGLRGNYYFSGYNRSTAYVGLFGKQAISKVKSSPDSAFVRSDAEMSGEFTESSAGVVGGYQWNWSMLSLTVGGGFISYTHPDSFELASASGASKFTYDIDNRDSSFVLDVGLGLQF